MIRHVVMWKFQEDTREAMLDFLGKLEGLRQQIPQIVDMEVGVDCGGSGHYDAILISTFRNREDLEAYQHDPRHVAVSGLCKAIRTDRVAVDFEV